jgi:hypothetical protein
MQYCKQQQLHERLNRFCFGFSAREFAETHALDPMVLCVGVQSSDYHAAMSDIMSLCVDKPN